jgi:hypothetical protein
MSQISLLKETERARLIPRLDHLPPLRGQSRICLAAVEAEVEIVNPNLSSFNQTLYSLKGLERQ